MKRAAWVVGVAVGYLILVETSSVFAQDWPQWRGANRDARATGFKAPATWPTELKQQWKVIVGDGVATPSLVGDKLYVFARQEGNEILRCLDAATGSELWQDKYEAQAATGAASGFAGPRASPTVVDGKVVTFGVRGTLSCLDTASGKVLWRKDDFAGAWPRFFTSSSPIVVDGLCIAQLGGDNNGGIVAYDLTTGEEKWKWPGDGPAYSSPVLLTVDGDKVVVAVTSKNLVALSIPELKQLWQIAYTQGRYNSATPIVDGQTLIYAGPTRGITAVKIEKQGDELAAKEAWKSPNVSVQFNTPVLKDGRLYGLSNLNALFCVNTQDSENVAWSTPLGPQPAGAPAGGGQPGSTPSGGGQPSAPAASGAPAGGAPTGSAPADSGKAAGQSEATPSGGQPAATQPGGGQATEGQPGGGQPAGGRGPGGGGRGRGGRGGGGGGYGSVVDAGSVLLALNPTGQLVVFEPNDKEFKQLASYKVAERDTYAYPVLAGNRIYIKDKDSLTLWTVE